MEDQKQSLIFRESRLFIVSSLSPAVCVEAEAGVKGSRASRVSPLLIHYLLCPPPPPTLSFSLSLWGSGRHKTPLASPSPSYNSPYDLYIFLFPSPSIIFLLPSCYYRVLHPVFMSLHLRYLGFILPLLFLPLIYSRLLPLDAAALTQSVAPPRESWRWGRPGWWSRSPSSRRKVRDAWCPLVRRCPGLGVAA